MAAFYPIAFPALAARLERDIAAGGAIYGLPRRSIWTPDPARDVSLVHHGRRIASPAGPAAGPHTQLAQNIVLAWLAGGRFLELKTVQVQDRLEIPRPCIFAPHVGYNVEWSQELSLPESAREYAKAWLLVHFAANLLGTAPGCAFDASVGYDLAGLRSEGVRGFLAAMADGTSLLDELRDELPPRLGDVPVPPRIATSLTLSTFHGCPPGEVEAMAARCMDDGWDTAIKLNPTLLGFERARSLLDGMGYDRVRLDAEAFERDLSWEALLALVPRLASRGRSFAVKLGNTLVCRSAEPPFPPGDVYLSGAPLHAMHLALAARLREAFPEIPVSFAGGVDAQGFADCVEGGLGPVTSCTDLLQGKGYAKLGKYLRNLEARMAERGAPDLDRLRQGRDRFLGDHAAAVAQDPRYGHLAHAHPPRKIGRRLDPLDCVACDKCVPACPNAANFAVHVPKGVHTPGRVRWEDASFEVLPGEPLVLNEPHQVMNTFDACNECGHCDAWCPQDGAPWRVKPRLFLDRRAWEEHRAEDGFYVDEGYRRIRWRRRGEETSFEPDLLRVPGGAVHLRGDAPVSTEGRGEVDLAVAVWLRLLLESLSDPASGSWLPRES